MRALQILVVFSLALAAYSQIPQCTADSSCPICNCNPDMGCAGDIDVCSACDFSMLDNCAQLDGRTIDINTIRTCYVLRDGKRVRTLTASTGPICLFIEAGARIRDLDFSGATGPTCIMNNGDITGNTILSPQDDCMFVGATGSTKGVTLGEGTNTFSVFGGAMTSGTVTGGSGSDCIKGLYDMMGTSGSSIRNVVMGAGPSCYLGQQDSRAGVISGEGDMPHFVGLVDGAEIQGVDFTGMSDDGISIIGGGVVPGGMFNLGGGNDRVFIENAQIFNDIMLGSGDDFAVVGCSRVGAINGGAGADCIDLFSSVSDSAAGVTGDAGEDTCIVSDSSVNVIDGGQDDDMLYNCNNQITGGVMFPPPINGGDGTDLCTADNMAQTNDCEDTSNMPPCPPPVVAP